MHCKCGHKFQVHTPIRLLNGRFMKRMRGRCLFCSCRLFRRVKE